ncbi:MAG: DUF3575 domain-containing protein, partial [Muribaculaceae bacterium]|nr:DUF3575 domain-containing protein [Muribaculaceae bacterium]
MKHLATLLFAFMAVFCANSQVAVKSNLLFDAMTTPNLGMEVSVGKKNTFQGFYGLHPWTVDPAQGERQ